MRLKWAVLLGFMGLLSALLLSVRAFYDEPAPASSAAPEPWASAPEARASAPGPHASAAKPPLKKLTGDLDVTFLVAADTHIGYQAPESPGRDPIQEPVGIERTNLAMIEAMNNIAGKAYPVALGGSVALPRAVLVAGDLTEHGGREQWRLWELMYGLTGKEGALRIPVFEGAGNHDRNKNWYVRERIAKRHGGRFYHFDLGDLRLICLGEGPDEEGLELLEEALAGIERDVPVVVYLHYPVFGPYSEDHWFGRGELRQRMSEHLHGYRVVGVFHGHYHASGAYRWRDIDVYNVGSPKYLHSSFAVVEVNADQMKVASYDYLLEQWIWWHRKPISDAADVEERVGVADGLEHERRPDFSLTVR